MTDDLLKRASRALREETAEADEGARFTRARVLASMQQSQVRRRARLAVLLPIAACFAAATAFGMVDGRTPAIVRSITQALGFGEAAPTPPALKAPPARRAAEPTPAPAEVTPPPVAPPPVAPPPVTPPPVAPPPVTPPPVAPRTEMNPRASSPSPSRLAPSASARASASAALTQPEAAQTADHAVESTPRPADISDRAHELYRVAHHTHFVEQDFASALRTWDAYLEAAPGGRFVLEARYNRALCLVRLGRTSDARAALEPFASGKYSGYRQAEARALIDAMSQ